MGFNLHKFASEEQDKKLEIQRKIMQFLNKERPTDSNIYLAPDGKEVLFSIGGECGRHKSLSERLQRHLGKRIKVKHCDKCECPKNWEPALGIRGFGRRTAVINALAFSCEACGQGCSQDQARNGCPHCRCSIFRVARHGNDPLIKEPQRDPYRQHDTQEDGYKMTTPGGEGDISGSSFGQDSRRDMEGTDFIGKIKHEETNMVNHQLPQDQDAFDVSATPEPDMGAYQSTPSSPALTDDDSPLNPRNYKENRPVGVYNMPRPFNAWKGQDVFDRIRHRMKGNR